MNQQSLPKHKVCLKLEHNPGRVYYDDVKTWLGSNDNGTLWEWKTPEQRKRAIDTNEVWTLDWYPRTPIGSYSIAAPTLEELLEFASDIEKEYV